MVVELVVAATAAAYKGKEVVLQEKVETEKDRLAEVETGGDPVAEVWAAATVGLARVVESWARVEAHEEVATLVEAAWGTVVVVTARGAAVEVDPEMAVAVMVRAEEARVKVEVAKVLGVTEGAGTWVTGKVGAAMAAAGMETAVRWAAEVAVVGL